MIFCSSVADGLPGSNWSLSLLLLLLLLLLFCHVHLTLFPMILYVRTHRFLTAQHEPSPQLICRLSFIFVTSTHQSHYPHRMQWAEYTTMRPSNRYSKRDRLNGSQRRICGRDSGCCDADWRLEVMTSEFVTTVRTKIRVFWDITPCRRVTIYWRFWTKVLRQFSRSSSPRGVTVIV